MPSHRPLTFPAEELLDALRAQQTVGVAVLDTELRYVMVNDAVAAMNALPADDHPGRTVREVLPFAADQLEPMLRGVLAGEPVIDLEMGVDDGRRFRVSYLPLGAPPEAIAALVVETTASSRAQVEIRIAQQRLALALEGTDTGSFEWDVASNDVRWSDTMGPLWGRPRGWQPATYEEYLATVHPDDRDGLAAAVRDARGNGTGYHREFRCLWPDGQVRWMESRVHVLEEAGRPSVLVGLVIDTDERRRRELAAEYLARASLALADSLDLRATLQHVAELALPELADWCAVHVREREGAPERVAVAAPDEEKAALARTLQERYPAPADAPTGVPAVVRTGRSELYPEVPEELLEASARDAEHLELIRQLGLRSGMIVPMLARGRTVGAITFASVRPGRTYGTAELELAEELGRRAGLAVDNARLHAGERDAVRRLGQLQSITDVALTHLDLDELLGELLARLRQVAGAASASVLLLDADRGDLVVRAADGTDAGPPVGSRVPREQALVGRPGETAAPVLVGHVRSPRELLVHRREGDMETVGVPLRAQGGVIGVLHVTRAAADGFAREDLDLLERAADRAAVAIDHARVYERMRETAVTLQRSLLPLALPRVEGLEAAVRYVAGQEGTEVGGDWYDVFRLDERVAVVVGDVAGRGVHAAAGMGQLRAALRAYAVDRSSPSAALEGLDGFMAGLGGVGFATVALVTLDPGTGEATVCLAGHPPPVVRRAAGGAEVLVLEPGPPIGAGPVERPCTEVALDPGDVLLLYTDGLVERRDRLIDERVRDLAAVAAEAPPEPEAFADHVLGAMLAGEASRDDVAVVALRRT